MTREQLGEHMGVSVRTIDGFVAEGMPSYTWGMKRTRRFLVSEAVAWASGRESRLVPDRDRDQTAPGEPNRRSSSDA